MSLRGAGLIAGAYEHPERIIPNKSLAQVHSEVAAGALADAGLSFADVDGYFCDASIPGLMPLSLTDYMGIRPRHVASTETGGSSYLVHVAQAVQAIKAGACDVALITLAGLPRQLKPNPSASSAPSAMEPRAPAAQTAAASAGVDVPAMGA